MKNFPNVTIKT